MTFALFYYAYVKLLDIIFDRPLLVLSKQGLYLKTFFRNTYLPWENIFAIEIRIIRHSGVRNKSIEVVRKKRKFLPLTLPTPFYVDEDHLADKLAYYSDKYDADEKEIIEDRFKLARSIYHFIITLIIAIMSYLEHQS